MKKYKDMLAERIEKEGKYEAMRSDEVFNAFFSGDMSIEKLALWSKRRGLKLAEIKDIEDFLKNNMAIQWKVNETGISKNNIIKKGKELLKFLKTIK